MKSGASLEKAGAVVKAKPAQTAASALQEADAAGSFEYQADSRTRDTKP